VVLASQGCRCLAAARYANIKGCDDIEPSSLTFGGLLTPLFLSPFSEVPWRVADICYWPAISVTYRLYELSVTATVGGKKLEKKKNRVCPRACTVTTINIYYIYTGRRTASWRAPPPLPGIAIPLILKLTKHKRSHLCYVYGIYIHTWGVYVVKYILCDILQQG
jgi:hypothetical protein